MIEKNLVSIIVPCYNQAEFVSETLDSVLKQTYPSWECIIVNDGSTDDSLKKINHYIQLDKRFKLVDIPNSGLGSARNKGIEKSKGEYILPLDADDIISSNFIQELLNSLLSSSKNKIAYSKAYKFGFVNEFWNLPEFNRDNLLVKNQIYCTALYRKSDYLSIKGYDDKMPYMGVEDWEFWIRLFENGGDAILNNEATFYYRTKPSSMITKLEANKHKVLRKYIYKKHKKLYDNLNVLVFNLNWANLIYESNLELDDKYYIDLYKNVLRQKLKLAIGDRNFFVRKKILFNWYIRQNFSISFKDLITL